MTAGQAIDTQATDYPLSEVPRRAVGRGFTRTPIRLLTTLARQLERVEFCCLALILDATVGWSRRDAPLSISQFRAAANASRRGVETALGELAEAGLVEWSSRNGARWYRVAADLWPSGQARMATARCPRCGDIGPIELDSDQWVQLPHEFFRRLLPALTYAQVRVLGALVAAIGWRGIEASVSVSDVQEITGLSRSAIEEAWRALEDGGLLACSEPDRARRQRGGRACRWSVCRDRFADPAPRRPRTVERHASSSSNGEHPAKATQDVTAAQQVTDITSPAECQTRVLGRCVRCGRLVVADLLPAEALALFDHSPEPAVAAKPSPPPDEGKRAAVEALLLPWAQCLGEVPSREIIAEITYALGPASADQLSVRIARRWNYIATYGQSFRVFLPLARDAAAVAGRVAGLEQTEEARRQRALAEAAEAEPVIPWVDDWDPVEARRRADERAREVFRRAIKGEEP